MTVLSNIITPSNVLTTTNTATVTNKTLTSPTVTGVTVSDGTANGVTYLNGSKVLTSGSALNFNGTSLAIGDTAASADGSSLYIYGNLPASTQLGIKIGGNANSYTQQAIRFYDTYFGAYAGFLGFTTNSLTFGQGTTEGMRLTSTGLGIGTSSPSQKLSVNGADASNNVALFTRSGGSNMYFYVDTGANVGFFTGSNASGSGVYANATSNAVQFNTSGALRATLDSAGNLGLGVTPAAWSSSWKALQIGTITALYSQNSNTYLGNNEYFNSSGDETYLTSSFATRYLQHSTGQHRWYTAPSGTAGNTISFTQAMTLDASGNLGIGTTSPTGSLEIATSSATSIVANSSNATGGWIEFKRSGTAYAYIGNAGALTGSNTDDMAIQAVAGKSLRFQTNGNNTRLVIDTSGNLLVGTTSQISAGKLCLLIDPANNSGLAMKPTADNYDAIRFLNASSSQVGGVSCTSSATSYNTSSDYRLKNTIAPMTGALAKVALLKPCTYKWNVDGSDSQGFIAHELAEVVPECVTGEKDAVDDEGNPVYQGIDTSFLVATLTAAIQELKAEFDAYKASHP